MAVSATVAAIAVWWAAKNAPAKPKKSGIFKEVGKASTEMVYEEVRFELGNSPQ